MEEKGGRREATLATKTLQSFCNQDSLFCGTTQHPAALALNLPWILRSRVRVLCSCQKEKGSKSFVAIRSGELKAQIPPPRLRAPGISSPGSRRCLVLFEKKPGPQTQEPQRGEITDGINPPAWRLQGKSHLEIPGALLCTLQAAAWEQGEKTPQLPYVRALFLPFIPPNPP